MEGFAAARGHAAEAASRRWCWSRPKWSRRAAASQRSRACGPDLRDALERSGARSSSTRTRSATSARSPTVLSSMTLAFAFLLSRHAADDVGEPAARRGGGAARAGRSPAADRGEPVVGIGAARRRRRPRRRCRSADCSPSCSTASFVRCPAFRRGCTSSCSSRGPSCCMPSLLCGHRRGGGVIPIWLATRLPIAATLRREILS